MSSLSKPRKLLLLVGAGLLALIAGAGVLMWRLSQSSPATYQPVEMTEAQRQQAADRFWRRLMEIDNLSGKRQDFDWTVSQQQANETLASLPEIAEKCRAGDGARVRAALEASGLGGFAVCMRSGKVTLMVRSRDAGGVVSLDVSPRVIVEGDELKAGVDALRVGRAPLPRVLLGDAVARIEGLARRAEQAPAQRSLPGFSPRDMIRATAAIASAIDGESGEPVHTEFQTPANRQRLRVTAINVEDGRLTLRFAAVAAQVPTRPAGPVGLSQQAAVVTTAGKGWLLDATPVGWVLLAAGALLVGISKTGLPGSGIMAVVIFAAAAEHVGGASSLDSTGWLLPLLIMGDVFAVGWYRRHAVWRHLVRLMPVAVVGIVLGHFLMEYLNKAKVLPKEAYSVIIGGIVLLMVVLGVRAEIRSARKFRAVLPAPDDADSSAAIDAVAAVIEPQPTASWAFVVTMGLLAGVTTMMANAAGPIMILYLTAMRLPKHQFIGTGAWYFLLLNCIKVPFQMNLGNITTASLLSNLVLLPVIVGGALLGLVLFRIVSEKLFKVLVQVLAAAAAVQLLVKGIVAW